jgi:uncharacterized membrane protein HdeD (DUF308 family)
MASTPPPPPPTEQQRAPEPVPRRRRNGAGTAALVIGVVSLVLAILLIFAPLALLLGIIAIIFGIVGISRASRGDADNRSHAVAGLVTGILGVVLALIIGIGFVALFADHQQDLRRFGTCMSAADNDEERASCVRRLGERLEDD